MHLANPTFCQTPPLSCELLKLQLSNFTLVRFLIYIRHSGLKIQFEKIVSSQENSSNLSLKIAFLIIIDWFFLVDRRLTMFVRSAYSTGISRMLVRIMFSLCFDSKVECQLHLLNRPPQSTFVFLCSNSYFS